MSKTKKIALPVEENKVCAHFGHAPEFIFYSVDLDQKAVTGKEVLQAPPHEPGKLPVWLADKGADVIITGGMGQRAQDLLKENNIEIILGISGKDPEAVVQCYLGESLNSGTNLCDH